jgi:hypothetical protein
VSLPINALTLSSQRHLAIKDRIQVILNRFGHCLRFPGPPTLPVFVGTLNQPSEYAIGFLAKEESEMNEDDRPMRRSRAAGS